MKERDYLYSIQQLKVKMKKLKSEYKKAIGYNKQTGVEPLTCNFFDVS